MIDDADPLRFFNDNPDVTFTHADLVAITGIVASDIQNWVNRDLARPLVVSPGRQGKRVYTFPQVCAFAAASKLMRVGVSASISLKLAPIALLGVIEAQEGDGMRFPAKHYFTLLRRNAGKTDFTITTFNDHSIPIEDLFSEAVVLLNTGETMMEVAEKALLRMKANADD